MPEQEKFPFDRADIESVSNKADAEKYLGSLLSSLGASQVSKEASQINQLLLEVQEGKRTDFEKVCDEARQLHERGQDPTY